MMDPEHLLADVVPTENKTRRICIEVTIDHSSKGVEQLVKTLLRDQVLDFVDGYKPSAAGILGVSLKTLYNRIEADSTTEE